MRKWGIYIVLIGLLVLAILVSPVLAKDPGPPEKGVLFEAIASLQQQVDELQAQVDAIDNSVIDGVDWSELSGIPADIADGDDGGQNLQFGAWEDKEANTTYLAETDGLVVAYASLTDIFPYDVALEGLTDNLTSPPTTVRVEVVAKSDMLGEYDSLTMPVREGDYWRVNVAEFDDSCVFWIPFGN